ncbi:T9SS type A sorting domain-containing protein, partial [Lentimicrobium sp. S6]|uniref:T9SS type A sorting domain-containing protein n=1 Tax=Lentimicrobium sp. S6 TaxID=2735872 RepID=UPI001556D5A3
GVDFTEDVTNILCFGDNNGAIVITGTGGTPDYQYSIDDGENFQSFNEFNGLLAGEYVVVIRDANACSNSHMVTITEPLAFSFTTNTMDATCFGEASGSMEFIPDGGVGPYEYSIDNGDTWFTDNLFNDLLAGDYQVKVRDANNCELTELVTVSEPSLGVDFTEDVTNILCFGDNNGAIVITGTGGTPDYQYSIDDGENFQSFNEFNGLLAGEYVVVIRDANACSNSHMVTITEPLAFSFTTNTMDATCFGEASGSMEFIPDGGVGPYEYSIDNGDTWFADNLFNDLLAGDYQVKVRDANNCELTELVTVSEPSSGVDFTEDVTNILCFGDNNGAIVITGTGGTPDYQYSIDDGENFQSFNEFNGLSAGEYVVVIRDANNCTNQHEVTITEPESGVDFTEIVTDVSCFGESTGSIQLIASGGLSPYKYSLTGSAPWQFSSYFGDLAVGEYQMAVRDVNLCVSTHVVSVFEPENALTLVVNSTNVQCFGGDDGEIEMIANGGVIPYEYSIDNGTIWQGSSVFDNLEQGNYNVMVRDANLCQQSYDVFISQPSSLPEVFFTGLDAEYCEDIVEVILTGNQAPVGEFEGLGITDLGNGTAVFNPSEAGVGGPFEIIYSYSDASGCLNSESQFTLVNEVLTVDFTGLSAEYCIDASVSVLIGSEAPEGSFSGPGITDNGNGTATFNPFAAGEGGPFDILYEFNSVSSCSSQTTHQTIVNPLPAVYFTGLEDANCIGDPPQVLTGNQAPGGMFTGPGIVDNGDGTATFDPNIVGLGGPYTIFYEYSDAVGCSNSSSQSTTVYNIPNVSFTGLASDYCEGASEILITGNQAPNGEFNGPGIVDQNDGTAYFYPVLAGVGGPYHITYIYQNSNGCSAIDEQETNVVELPVVTFSGLESSYCINNTMVDLVGNFAPDGEFSGPGILDNGDGTAVFDPAIAGVGGVYEIKYEYSSPQGCYGEEIQNVEVFDIDVLEIIGLNVNYCSQDPLAELIGNMAPFGSFTGSGIIDNGDGTANFSPLLAGAGGPYDIMYFYTNENNCYSETTESTIVDLTPQISFTGLGSVYCIDSDPITITGDQPDGIYSGPGILDNEDGTAIFNPSDAGAGENHEIIYSVTSSEGCYAEDLQQVNVEGLQELSFDGLESDYCFTNPASIITGNMAPLGTFIGQGIIDNEDGTAIFDPQVAGIGGPYIITYEYQTGVCENIYEQEVTVFSSTAVSFTGLDETYCKVNTEFILTGSQAPSGYFTGEGIIDYGDGTASFNPSILGSGGPFGISYHFENENGCISYVEEFTNIVDGPIASFDYSLGGCVEDAIFVDQSTSTNGDIINWSWDFDDPDSEGSDVSDIQNPLHQFVSNKSSFNIKLIVGDEQGCLDSIVQLIEPFSTSTIRGHVYSSDGTDITDGYVLVYLLSDGIISTQVDSVGIADDGSFACDEMATCVDYIFRAYANRSEYPDVMPRWHIDAYFWLDAIPVSPNWDDILVDNIDINLYQVPLPPEGTSGIGGGVYYTGGKGEPVKNVDVVLEFDAADDKGDEVVGYKPTDELGHWEFDKLGEGTFKISLDIPGLNIDSVYTVSISAPNTNITNLDYYIDPEHGIYMAPTGLDELDDLGFGSIGLFPNPNSGQFYLEILKSENISRLDINSIELWDMEGRLIKDLGIKFKGDHYLAQLNLSDIEPGMYFIKVKNKEEFGVVKFVIQRK